MHLHHCISRFSRRIPPLRTFSRLYSTGTDVFYSGKTYEEVVENKELVKLLAQSNFEQLSLSQVLAYPPLSRGKSVVLAAETGSGKTLAYLVPLIESVMKGKIDLHVLRRAQDGIQRRVQVGRPVHQVDTCNTFHSLRTFIENFQ